MTETIGYKTYRNTVRRQMPCIIYYEDKEYVSSNHFIDMMEYMMKNYPLVKCYKVNWHERGIKGVPIDIQNLSQVLCFRCGIQIAKVSIYDSEQLISLFQTVYNDCILNNIIVFNRILYAEGLIRRDHIHKLYHLKQPAYTIPISHRFHPENNNKKYTEKLLLDLSSYQYLPSFRTGIRNPVSNTDNICKLSLINNNISSKFPKNIQFTNIEDTNMLYKSNGGCSSVKLPPTYYQSFQTNNNCNPNVFSIDLTHSYVNYSKIPNNNILTEQCSLLDPNTNNYEMTKEYKDIHTINTKSNPNNIQKLFMEPNDPNILSNTSSNCSFYQEVPDDLKNVINYLEQESKLKNEFKKNSLINQKNFDKKSKIRSSNKPKIKNNVAKNFKVNNKKMTVNCNSSNYFCIKTESKKKKAKNKSVNNIYVNKNKRDAKTKK